MIRKIGDDTMKCKEIVDVLETLSPKYYACDWDNVGLLVGRQDKEVKNIMIALDATKDVIAKAIENQVDMLITHHPMIFSSLKQINEEQFTTEKVLSLAEHGISYYAMHTNFDAVGGMGELAAGEKYLNLRNTKPIDFDVNPDIGMGRYGILPNPMTAYQVAEYVKAKFDIPFVLLYQREQDKDKVFDKIAVMPGSGRSEMKVVKDNGYTLYLTGDYGHHEGLDAMDMGLTIIDATHYGLEHIFISFIGEYLKDKLNNSEMNIMEADMGSPMKVI